jgi:hypothetical protein
MKVKDIEWRKNLFVKTEIEVCNPLFAKDSVVKVVMVEPDDLEMNLSIQKMYRARKNAAHNKNWLRGTMAAKKCSRQFLSLNKKCVSHTLLSL